MELADGLYSSLAFPPMVLVVSSLYSDVSLLSLTDGLQDRDLTDTDCLTGTFLKSLDMSPRLYLDMKSLSVDMKSLSADTKSLSVDTKSLFAADNIVDY